MPNFLNSYRNAPARVEKRVLDLATAKPRLIQEIASYIRDPLSRFAYKSSHQPRYNEMTIPFIRNKKITLSNAGLSTGAVISENLLDSIAKYAKEEKLPIKTALGLAAKESTLGNPTDDKSIYKLIGAETAKFFKRGGGRQFINKEGNDIDARRLINYYKDTWNPYEEAIKIAKQRVLGSNSSFYRPNAWGDKNNPFYRREMEIYKRNKTAINKILTEGERYADRKAIDRYLSIYGNVLQAAFRDYKNNPNNYNPGQSNYSDLVNKRGDELWGSPEIQNWYSRTMYKRNGGTIHINPKNRGKFNALKRRTGKTTEQLTHSKNPLTRKRAIFAQNAAKWKHG